MLVWEWRIYSSWLISSKVDSKVWNNLVTVPYHSSNYQKWVGKIFGRFLFVFVVSLTLDQSSFLNFIEEITRIIWLVIIDQSSNVLFCEVEISTLWWSILKNFIVLEFVIKQNYGGHQMSTFCSTQKQQFSYNSLSNAPREFSEQIFFIHSTISWPLIHFLSWN